ncbi:hypothetical protein NYR72_09925 [Actinobacillus equuli subsp. haemolyticus]|uniref:hypothetical protein n=1 Tax=Actinobacillus equuli TaxID=718 RepID=UPI00241839D2|nr:hypothetical protein [Actinobacillus equuli]MDG4948810.1 hypothetical protein [Actinobacillus equuli subsp. haemolyticus]
MVQVKITKKGCFGSLNGEFQELPIGTVLTLEVMPSAFVERCEVVAESQGELHNNQDSGDSKQGKGKTKTKSN